MFRFNKIFGKPSCSFFHRSKLSAITGVTRVTYNMSESTLLLIPHPSVAKARSVYDLYATGFMMRPCTYYPIVSTEDVPAGGVNGMGSIITKIYDVSPLTQADYLVYASEHFGRIYQMMTDLCNQFNNANTVDAWYTRDLMTTYDSSLQDLQCPVFRWNYTDKLLNEYPDRFRIHNNEFGLFSLREVVNGITVITDTGKANAQSWAENYKTTEWTWRWNILGKHVWFNVANSLPTFTLLDHTN